MLRVLLLTGMTLLLQACGPYPSYISSTRDIRMTSASKDDIVIGNLPLEDWPALKKFTNLQHLRLNGTFDAVTDEHIRVLGGLEFPRLRNVGLNGYFRLTDEAIESLSSTRSITGLGLAGTAITDHGMSLLATRFPKLTGISVSNCRGVTESGFASLAGSSITSVGLSLTPLTQEQIERIIASTPNVIWWHIDDPHHRLDHEPLRKMGEANDLTIQAVDENRSVKSITLGSRGGG